MVLAALVAVILVELEQAAIGRMKVLFVCHGNICRSPMAEFILKKIVKERDLKAFFEDIASCAVSSEEIGNPVYLPARAELARHGISCNGKTARRISVADYELFDRIIVMDKSNLRLIERILGRERMDKVSMLLDNDVADPWYTNDYHTTYKEIVKGCENLINSVSL